MYMYTETVYSYKTATLIHWHYNFLLPSLIVAQRALVYCLFRL